MPYHRNRTSRHSWSPISVLLTVDKTMVIHSPDLVPCLSQQGSIIEVASMASSSVISISCTWRRHNSSRTSHRCRAWYPVLNSVRTHRPVTRWHVTTHKTVQFSEANRVGLGIVSPTWFTRRRMIPCVGTLDVSPCQWRFQGGVFQWPHALPSYGSVSPSSGHYAGIQPRRYLLDTGSIPVEFPSSESP